MTTPLHPQQLSPSAPRLPCRPTQASGQRTWSRQLTESRLTEVPRTPQRWYRAPRCSRRTRRHVDRSQPEWQLPIRRPDLRCASQLRRWTGTYPSARRRTRGHHFRRLLCARPEKRRELLVQFARVGTPNNSQLGGQCVARIERSDARVVPAQNLASEDLRQEASRKLEVENSLARLLIAQVVDESKR